MSKTPGEYPLASNNPNQSNIGSMPEINGSPGLLASAQQLGTRSPSDPRGFGPGGKLNQRSDQGDPETELAHQRSMPKKKEAKLPDKQTLRNRQTDHMNAMKEMLQMNEMEKAKQKKKIIVKKVSVDRFT